MGMELPEELRKMAQDTSTRMPTPEPAGTLERFFVPTKDGWVAFDAPSASDVRDWCALELNMPHAIVHAEQPEFARIDRRINLVTGKVTYA